MLSCLNLMIKLVMVTRKAQLEIWCEKDLIKQIKIQN